MLIRTKPEDKQFSNILEVSLVLLLASLISFFFFNRYHGSNDLLNFLLLHYPLLSTPTFFY